MTSEEKVANHVREGEASAAAEPRGTGRLRRWMFRLAVMTVVPALFLLLLEGGLRLFGYGYPTNFFVRITGRADYTANDRFGWRFFPRALSRSSSLLHLPAEKGEDVYRIFILGGSAARGEPGMAFGFGRILEVMLRTRYPETRFEVVNTALTAINSHVVLPITRDCARHAPDLFIVCMGNNEVVGPYGAGTILRPYSPSLAVIRAGLWIKTTKIGQLLEAAVGAVRGGGDRKWRGMEMFIEHRVAAADPRLTQVYDHFRENLTDICRVGTAAGAQVILCTVPVNLRNCAPFASEHRPGLRGAELARWEQAYQAGTRLEASGDLSGAVTKYLAAEKLDGQFADLHFRLGQCYLGLKRPAEARRHCRLARDLDTLRFRADTGINEIIRQVAADRSGEGVALVDAERRLAESSPVTPGLPGEEFFYEHVHLTFEGNYVLARALFRRLTEVLPASVRSGGEADGPPPSLARCAELLVLTGWNRHRMVRQMWEVTARPPFTGQLDHPRRRGRLFSQLRELEPQMQAPALAAAAVAYERAIQAAEGDLLLRDDFARLQFSRGDYASVEEQCRTLLNRLPDSRLARGNLACALLAQGKVDEAQGCFERAREPVAEAIEAHHIAAAALIERGKLAEAVALYRRVLEIDPEHAGTRTCRGDADSARAPSCFGLFWGASAPRFEAAASASSTRSTASARPARCALAAASEPGGALASGRATRSELCREPWPWPSSWSRSRSRSTAP